MFPCCMSTTKGRNLTSSFELKEGNPLSTVFHIWCQTGAYIRPYSHFASEDEVLLPACTNLVLLQKWDDQKTTHFLWREVVIGTKTNVVLWSDEKNYGKGLGQQTENMITAKRLQRNCLEQEIQFIFHTSFDQTANFMTSPIYQQRIKSRVESGQ